MTLKTSWLDWKLGGRMLVKYPGLTVIGGLTLAVAIGVGTAWFELTQQIVNPRLPLADGERIIRVDNWNVTAPAGEAAAPHFQQWREQLTTIEHAGAYRTLQRNLITADGVAEPMAVAEISASAFPLTRIAPLLGRALVDTDGLPGAADVVVIGYDVWQRRFGGAQDVIGRSVRVGRTVATIVGVMPASFHFPRNHQVWMPLSLTSVAATSLDGSLFGRLAAGATVASAQAQAAALGERMAALNAESRRQPRPRVALFAAADSNESLFARLSNILAWLILGAACANVATLMFVRTATREAEIVVRNALGASRGRVLMQLFIEALVLCIVAAIVGLIAASFALEYVSRQIMQWNVNAPFWWQFGIGPRTILYASLLAVAGAAIVGLTPALKATSPRIATALKDIGSGGTSIRFGPVWSIMIALQVASAALCLPFAAYAGYFMLQKQVPPFPTSEYVTFGTRLDREAAGTASDEMQEDEFRAHLLNVYAELERRVEAEAPNANVTFANGITSFPLEQLELQRETETPVLVDTNIDGKRARTAYVAIDFFDALRMPLVAGRAFIPGDVDAQRAVVINEALARNLGGNPIGARIRYAARRSGEQPGQWYEVVGVVRGTVLDRRDADFVFVPVSAASAAPLEVAVHVRGDAAAFAPRLRQLAAEVEPGLRLYNLLPLDEVTRRNKLPEIQGSLVLIALTILVMALSAAGLYSLMSVAVTRRTREIGIRLAIGASARAVLATLFARVAMQVGGGIVLAIVLLPPLMKALGMAELHIKPVLVVMLVASAGMTLVALAACAVPARRALRIQPTEAVKYGG